MQHAARRRQRKQGIYEFEDSLVYKTSSKAARAALRNLILKNQNKETNKDLDRKQKAGPGGKRL